MQKAANIISYIFHPIFLFFYAYVILLLLSINGIIDIFRPYLHIYRFIFITIYFFVFTVVLPLIIIYFVKRDFRIQDRSLRNIPYIIMIIIYGSLYFLLSKMIFPEVVHKYVFGIAVGLIILLVLNQFMKISMHSSGMGSILALFIYLLFNAQPEFYGIAIVWVMIAGIVGTARFILNEHTQKEIYYGYLTGFVSVYAILQLSYLPF